MNEARQEHCASGADRVPMGNGSTLNIDNILRQPEFARDGDGNGGECLVDFDALEVPKLPPRTFACLPHGGNRAEAKHARLDGCDAIGNKPGHGVKTTRFRPLAIR